MIRSLISRFALFFKTIRPELIPTTASIGARVAGASLLAAAYASPAFAQISGGKDPASILKNIGDFILGPFGQSLAGLGIVAIGLSWMFGRASLGLVAGVIGGIVIMFGAATLATDLIK